MARVRKIIHLDLDAFFCSVEELLNPELHGKAFAVGGRPDQRGVISTCSYAARLSGIHSAMPTSRALRLCPNLLLIHSRHGLYGEYSDRVMEILQRMTPLMEQVSIDEAFLDVTDLPQTGLELAKSLQSDIWNELKLPCSIGVASNKLVAKIATNIGKSGHRGITPPMAIKVVPPGEESAFLAPLPVKELWGVGPKMAEKLNGLGIHTIGQLAVIPETNLVGMFGKYGLDLALHARGIDESTVETERDVKSISQEVTYDRDVSDRKALLSMLSKLSAKVAYRLRKHGFCATVVRIKIRWPDFETHTRQTTIQQPTDQDSVIYATAVELFDGIWHAGKPVRLIGVGVAGLSEHIHQFGLWETTTEKEHRLLDALDELRERYGEDAVRKASHIKKGRKSAGKA